MGEDQVEDLVGQRLQYPIFVDGIKDSVVVACPDGILVCGDDEASQTTKPETTVEQTDGQNMQVEEEHRIIAGTVVLAQILDRLNLDAIAVPETVKDLPTRFDGLPDIGNAMDPDAEIIKSLNPTEVLSVSTLEYDFHR